MVLWKTSIYYISPHCTMPCKARKISCLGDNGCLLPCLFTAFPNTHGYRDLQEFSKFEYLVLWMHCTLFSRVINYLKENLKKNRHVSGKNVNNVKLSYIEQIKMNFLKKIIKYFYSFLGEQRAKKNSIGKNLKNL